MNPSQPSELPPDVELHRDIGLLVWRPHGVLDEGAINKIINFIGDLEAGSSRPFNRFADTLEVDAIDLNFNFVFHVSLYRRLTYRGPQVKSAMLVSSATQAQYMKMHAMLTQGSQLKVRIFEKREAVAEWLDVPLALLGVESSQ